MIDYLISLLGLTLLCAGWMMFQLWLKRQDPERENFRPGCGACKGGSCGAPADTATIHPESLQRK
jgi:hypothetical protein